MSAHTCHAPDCGKRVPPKMFMCRDHWFSLKAATRDAIWREYRPGQEQDKRPSRRYLAVQRAALAEIVFKPRDEAAALKCAEYLAAAEFYRLAAIAAGEGDPLPHWKKP